MINIIPRKKLGKIAEDIAVGFLRRKSLKIVERNFRCRLGEIDIIAKDGSEFVVVEVRSATGYFFHDPLESITARKIKRLQNLALIWLAKNKIYQYKIRFDIIIIVFATDKNNGYEIRHIENAF